MYVPYRKGYYDGYKGFIEQPETVYDESQQEDYHDGYHDGYLDGYTDSQYDEMEIDINPSP